MHSPCTWKILGLILGGDNICHRDWITGPISQPYEENEKFALANKCRYCVQMKSTFSASIIIYLSESHQVISALRKPLKSARPMISPCGSPRSLESRPGRRHGVRVGRGGTLSALSWPLPCWGRVSIFTLVGWTSSSLIMIMSWLKLRFV